MFGKNKRNIKIERRRGIALMLCFFTLFTVLPPRTFAKAAEEDMFISGFMDLPADVEVQTVPVGTVLEELSLPDTLKAVIYTDPDDTVSDILEENTESTVNAVSPEEETALSPIEDEPQETTVLPDEDEPRNEAGSDIQDEPKETDEIMAYVPSVSVIAQKKAMIWSNPRLLLTETSPNEGDNTSSSGDNTSSSGDSTSSSGDSASGGGGGSTAPTEGSAGPAEESTGPAEESTGSAEESTGPAEESTAPTEESTGPAEESTAPTEESTAPTEESTAPAEKNTRPAKELDMEDWEIKTITITDVMWQSSPEYDGAVEGTYVFTAILPDCYIVEDGVSMPQITVSVEGAVPPEASRVMDMLDALPDPAELCGKSANVPTDAVAAAREAMNDLSEEMHALIPAELTEKLGALEHIRDTLYDCLDVSCPWHYPPQMLVEMDEDETPVLLTLDDLIEDYDVTPPMSRFYRSRAAAQTNPQTLMLTSDNENNAHTGSPDNDIDKMKGSGGDPIEVSFTLDTLPSQSAYLAVKAFDVDEDEGETDYIYINDDIFLPRTQPNHPTYSYGYHNEEAIGYLYGMDMQWNTTVLEIPLEKLKLGKNVISIKVATNWLVTVDWMQLVLDGGSRDEDVGSFAITLGEPFNSKGNVQVPATVNIQQSGSNIYITEYSLIQAATGNALDSAFGQAQKEETVNLSLPLNAPSGTYKIIGLIKDPIVQKIKATDQISFNHIQGQGINLLPRVTHIQSPAHYTNGNVTIDLTAVPTHESMTEVTVEGGNSRTVTENGGQDFTINYKWNGQPKSTTYTVRVNNIDRTPPVLEYTSLTVIEDTENSEAERQLRAALICSDEHLSQSGLKFTLPDNFTKTLGVKNVEVTLSDMAGNTVSETCSVTVSPLPPKISQLNAEENVDQDTFSLSAVLEYTGGHTFTDTGFVVGAFNNPTLLAYDFKLSTASAVTNKGEQLVAELAAITEKLTPGVRYKVRAYAIEGDRFVVYSDQAELGLALVNYGVFSVNNNGDNTFTISRPADASDGTQKVYYRTVNGSAVGGTHFTHVADSITFAQGESSKTVSVLGEKANAQYGEKPATAYSNADRTYEMEIYRVDGGAELKPGATRATRTMSGSTAIDRTLYTLDTEKVETRTGGWEITDDGYYSGPPLKTTRYERAQYFFTCAPTFPYDDTIIPYVEGTMTGYRYRYLISAKETEDGWEHTWVATAEAKENRPSWVEGSTPISLSSKLGDQAMYSASFEIEKIGVVYDFCFPQPGQGSKGKENQQPHSSLYSTDTQRIIKDNDLEYFNMGQDETVYIHFSACGNNVDKWIINSFTHYARPFDTREPQVIGVAPMAGAVYKPGDPITVSVIFDEIVDSQNSSLSGLTIDTNYGTMSYAGGGDTNILFFTGTVPKNASDSIVMKSISDYSRIKDMCDQNGTVSSGGGSSSVTVELAQPEVTINSPTLENGTASGLLISEKATGYLQYCWSQEEEVPATGWRSGVSGQRYSTRQTSGVWYLHARAMYDGNGAIAYTKASFDFGTPENPSSPIPELTVTADNTDWARSRTLTVVRKPDNAEVSYEGPKNGTVSGGSVDVTHNGLYTFTLTSGGEIITQQVSVSRLDAVPPTLHIKESGNEGTIYNKLDFGAEASDALSGIQTVEYSWSNSSTQPAGWTAITGTDGSYVIPAYEAKEKRVVGNGDSPAT